MKFKVIAGLVMILAAVCSVNIASHWAFNQPKTPSMLVK